MEHRLSLDPERDWCFSGADEETEEDEQGELDFDYTIMEVFEDESE